jgi:hypothetical protein
MDQPAEDGIGASRVAVHVVPAPDRHLGGKEADGALMGSSITSIGSRRCSAVSLVIVRSSWMSNFGCDEAG